MKEHIFPPPLSMHQCALQTSCFNRMRVTLQVVSVSSSDLCSNRFKRNLPSPLQDSVDCRAYYPSDAHSSKRNHSLVTNPLGSSCLSYQSTHDIQINGTGPLMYNRMKGCTRDKMNCWYPDTNAGINELVAASRSLYLNRMMLAPRRPRVKRFTRDNGMKNITYYQGWAECSTSPDV
eukprot:scaffold4595_cov267-Chaetoceros_neogracile.AAC.8